MVTYGNDQNGLWLKFDNFTSLLEKSNYNWWGYNNYCGKGLLMLKNLLP